MMQLEELTKAGIMPVGSRKQHVGIQEDPIHALAHSIHDGNRAG
jgi:hypothetical protein